MKSVEDLPPVDIRPESCIRDAPTTFWKTLLQLGPGLIIAGSIVGSGELIATTKTGAQAGITLLWLIILGCVIKVFVQIELGRHTIIHGQTALQALNQVPGRFLSLNWIVWFWLAMMISGIVQLGGIVGGVGQAAAIAMPLTGDYRAAIEIPSEKEIRWMLDWEETRENNPEAFTSLPEGERQRIIEGGKLLRARLSELGERGSNAVTQVENNEKLIDPYTYDDKYWALAAALITVGLLYNGRYGLIQNLTTVLVVMFTFITIGNFVALQSTVEWHLSSTEILNGLSFGLPSATKDGRALATALAAFGIIGVGAAELVSYPYWCLEKGYALHTGPHDGTDAWYKRAKGWLRVMHVDVFLSMIVYTVATVAFYLIGVAVLYRFGRDPEGMRMTSTLAEAYDPMFGEYASWMFLIGAIAVLYSTFLVANAGHTRTYTDLFKLLGWIPRGDRVKHWRSISTLGCILPILCLIIFCTNIKPDVAVLAAGIMQALLLPMLGVGALFFRYWQTEDRLKPSIWFDICLLVSCVSFFITGAWGAYENFGSLISKYFM
ncbi:NRAMP family divalent metal transporter [Rubinisphaera italica]|uniref:Manganese transport protein MntH n=1 Tax=Rubinisphaera italica TaxID=2527969 RepID=A0A5C5XAZ5_9PLAN|nr:transmembrane Mn(2+) transporter [Rubinisphaera italica]TWT60196.1 manganese transport protein MntH [Rubinisphaera italica]